MINLYLINDKHLIFEESEFNTKIVAEQVFNIQIDTCKEVDKCSLVYFVIDLNYNNAEVNSYWTLDKNEGDEILIVDTVESVCKKINDIIVDDLIDDFLVKNNNNQKGLD